MEYILSLALLVLNLIDYDHDLGHVPFFVVGTVLFFVLFVFVQRKTKSFLATCIIMMCHTWQISWINIFGDPTANLQLPWFYILGVFIVGYALMNLTKYYQKEYSVFALLIFISFLIIFNYPLVISPSIAEGLKEYIMIGFFMIVLFVAYLFKEEVPNSCYRHFKSAFIWAAFTSSAFLIYQYVMYTYFGRAVFKVSMMQYFSTYQVSFRLLMEDHSCATIMLGCGVFYIVERINKKRWFIYVPAMLTVFGAMALTSRRTSTFVLIIVAGLYIMFHFKGLGNRFIFTMIFAVAGALMIYYLFIVRPVESVSQAISDNGRYVNYRSVLRIIRENPFGVGYDSVHIVALMEDGVVPHNTLLRWICMGSVFFALPLVSAIVFTLYTSKRKKMSCEFWAILYSVIASNFIPDILNARFFVIPCAIVFLINMKEEKTPPIPAAPIEAADRTI